MEEKNLIERFQSAKDARYNNIMPTQKGFELKKILIDDMFEEEGRITKGMTAKEQKSFISLLHIALKNIED